MDTGESAEDLVPSEMPRQIGRLARALAETRRSLFVPASDGGFCLSVQHSERLLIQRCVLIYPSAFAVCFVCLLFVCHVGGALL